MSAPRFSKSGIEYLDRMWGIYSGCRNLAAGICHVPACWAKGLVKRSPKNYPMGFDMPTFYPEALNSPKTVRDPLRIGVGWVGDVIGYGLAFRDQIFSTIEATPWHTYLFLTKNPDVLPFWGRFPANCWVGVTVTTNGDAPSAYYGLSQTQARVRFISFEPLAGAVGRDELRQLDKVSDWWVIGGQTQPSKPPRWEWVREIVESAGSRNMPVFLKDNIKTVIPKYPLLATTDDLIREYPDKDWPWRQPLGYPPELRELKSAGVN